MPDPILQSEATAALRETTVRIYDVAGLPLGGLDATKVTIKTAKPGAAAVASSATLTEVTGFAVTEALYRLRFPAGEVDTVGDLLFEITSGSSTITPVPGFVSVLATPAAVTAIKAVVDAIKVNADTLPAVLTLLHHNAKLDRTIFDVDGFMTSARLRGFASAAALAAATGVNPADDAEGEVSRFTITAVNDGNGNPKSYKIAKVL